MLNDVWGELPFVWGKNIYVYIYSSKYIRVIWEGMEEAIYPLVTFAIDIMYMNYLLYKRE